MAKWLHIYTTENGYDRQQICNNWLDAVKYVQDWPEGYTVTIYIDDDNLSSDDIDTLDMRDEAEQAADEAEIAYREDLKEQAWHMWRKVG